MAGFGFLKNTGFEWKGNAFRVRETPPDGKLLIESTATGALQLISKEELLHEYTAGQISGLSVSPSTESSKHPRVPSKPLELLAPGMAKEMGRRYRYLEAVYEAGPPAFTKSYLTPLIQAHADATADTSPPSVTSVYRWHRRYQTSQDARSLLPRFDRRGGATRQGDQVYELISAAVAEALKATPLASAPNIYSRLITKIANENVKRLPSDQIACPSIRTVYRMLKEASVYDMTALREGKAAADRRFQIVKRGVRTNRILERWEIDHTPMDLFVVDEKTWMPCGRPILTMIIDHKSRMPMGYYLSFSPPSAAAVVNALRHAILPKKKGITVLPDLPIHNDWRCYGLPEVIVVDNGLEFHGKTLDSLCMDLGFRVEYCPKRQPRFKGTIERFLKTINYTFAHQLPGTTFARFHQRGDYMPEKQAVLTFAELKHVLEKWFLDVYAQTPHRALGMTPSQAWKDGLQHHEPQLPHDLRTLEQRIGESVSRKLRRDGFAIHSIRFGGPSIAPIVEKYGEGVEVRVVFDSEDLSEVQVWGPEDQDPITVSAIDLEFAEGLTARQAKLITKLKRANGSKCFDPVALQKARADIAREIETLAQSRKFKPRQRGMAIQGLNSSKPLATQSALHTAPAQPVAPRSRNATSQQTTTLADTSAPPLLPAFTMRRGAPRD
ncbi:MAG: integrase [Hyphomicrobiales bacterium]|nr:MAG: integrase [Hyphomicrobiales bacterium]